MKNFKLFTTILLLIVMLTFSACQNPSSNGSEKVVITWKNYDGTVLQVEEVVVGLMPQYQGVTPQKASNGEFNYVFNGWDPVVVVATVDTTYTATFIESPQNYIVKWVNYDGRVLQEEILPAGSAPQYNGDRPQKPADEGVSYVFAGWTPNVTEVSMDVTYTAIFKEITGEEIAGIEPVLSADGKTIKYGFYPQTHVNDEYLISQLSILSTTAVNDWYLFEDNYYTKITAKVYNDEQYAFDDGTPIISGNEYWFKCEPISWQVLSDTQGNYFLLSEMLLDAYSYFGSYSNRTIDNQIIYANNYQYSDIRIWLNGEFCSTVFAFNDTFLQQVPVNNGVDTTNSLVNSYVCANTTDKVYLPSYQDYLNLAFGFDAVNDKSATRYCKVTDYARARGAWCNIKTDMGSDFLYNGSYWTRTPSSEFYYCAWNVNSGGYLSQYVVDDDSHGVRPCITIKF